MNLPRYEPQTVIPAMREIPQRIVQFTPESTLCSSKPITLQEADSDMEQIKMKLSALDRKVDMILCVVFDILQFEKEIFWKKALHMFPIYSQEIVAKNHIRQTEQTKQSKKSSKLKTLQKFSILEKKKIRS